MPLFMLWIYELEKLIPGEFTMAIDWSNLDAQVNGLAWTFTLVLFLVFFVCSVYMFMESRASKIEAQKTLHKGLALMLLLIGLAEAVPVRRDGDTIMPLASGFLPLQSLMQADGWVLVPADSEGYPAGTIVQVRPLP